jgi:hypothetical protein
LKEKKNLVLNIAGIGLLAVPLLEFIRPKLMLGTGPECIAAEMAASFLGLVILLKNNSIITK